MYAFTIFNFELWIVSDHGKVETKHAYLNVLTRGDLSSLVWMDSPLKYFKQTAPLNFRDVMLASGKLPPDALAGKLNLLADLKLLSNNIIWRNIKILASLKQLYLTKEYC
ncbi:hypothetical protein AVEN_43366-1 [Araneus ventricosus]|uniref:Uncharacterized protein n=1 Tax=Araneus ventricosus TaxID=182803 RepID=A0A4Y2CV87_ARAVE|nr:hypothetical protein AVEN_43366-1 [Araneus ventricosus]